MASTVLRGAAPIVGGLVDLSVRRSADLSGRRIGRSADDKRHRAVYLGGVPAPLLRVRGFRIDPVRLGSATGSEQLVLAVAGPLMAGTVAVRRHHPASAGIAAALLANVVAIAWKPPNAVSFGVAWLCSIYALT